MRAAIIVFLLLALTLTIASKHRPIPFESVDDESILETSYENARRSFHERYRAAANDHDRAAVVERGVYLYSLLVDSEAAPVKRRMAIPILRAALERGLPRELRAQVRFLLALQLKNRAESDPSRPLEKSVADVNEALGLLERVRTEDAKLLCFAVPTARKVEPMIAELRKIGVGRRAPEILGKDDSGRTIRVSNLRGKVVALFFWANWCPLCREGYDGDRRIVDEFKGRPFLMIGVNADESPKTMRSVVKYHHINWPSIWQGPEGPLIETWFVSPWPALYLIDARGIIRYSNGKHRPIDHKALAAAVDVLLDEQAREFPKDAESLADRPHKQADGSVLLP